MIYNFATIEDQQAIGEMLLAIDAGDTALTRELILRVVRRQPLGAISIIVQIASVAIESMKLATGDDWRDILNYALLNMSVDGVDAASPTMEDGEDG